ncbi:zinc finger BED domain-containing protein DAYSLEEPER-like [Arachis hypogaea]|uniref:zinc finger BED domain-containing protein DAYSLEEPER-like n=1 Tax=Arachis hypogaea TaxID=3818 RepID=UPI000DEC4C6C|nr:zinc finger BED domain-containing protein DAYSLEEPER-like [Arachis hypogaea]XP_025669562.1 zinc finger BED domain-containing protein DAYSLEEPER-like [Arachis hypogaea]XP_029143923.1 zinc finger BED domain-containing protein DAYSLEEPER-like [Arachis hypogaea]XP_029143924.1 zinc finger BED domain-containing protein DAYSLEEPER-like [Arachis hypogaea]XP_029150943.1 zinc finger BED domain-containing protein DAYSLEEPER-like [Arachis hypogaea]XP_029150944.1 zinc finger BED domain-containing protei
MRSRKKSIVWEYFTVKTVSPGCAKAYCKQCNKEFAYMTGSKQSGTSHLKRHISLGICLKNHQTPSGEDNVQPPKKHFTKAMSHDAHIPFDQEQCNDNIAKMIILHDYPLHIVEHQGFIDFVRLLQPQYNPLSLKDVQGDCVAMYLREKQNLLHVINGIPGRVNLTVDYWTSNQTLAYVFLRGHFIGGDWNLHHPILSVMMVPFPDSDNSLNQTILSCINDWHLEGRLFTITLDKLFSNGTLMGNLRCLLSVKNPVIFDGQLLSQNCYARVLSCLALDALSAMKETVGKIRESVKYVKSSEFHEEKFFALKRQLQVPSMMELLVDDQNKWDTVYRMLAAACELKEVFGCFDDSGPDYKMNLTMDDWKHVEKLCMCLKYLYDAANILTIRPYPTANLFFPEASNLLLELTHAAFSQDPFYSTLVMPLQEKFDRYWRESCLILAAAVAMDPRYKMKLVESTFARIFGQNSEPRLRIVEDGLHELFVEYIIQMLPSSATNGDEGNEATIVHKPEPEPEPKPCHEESLNGSLFAEDGLFDIELFISDFAGDHQFNSELSEYLEEPLEPQVQEFDILNWWRGKEWKYPTLSRMASDILSIPVSTLSADSAFDMQIRKMDSYRCSLGALTLEAITCTKDWFQYE